MATLKEALDQLAKGHELDNEQKKLIIDKWLKELGIQPCEDAISRQEVIETLKELDWRYNGHPGGEVYSAIYKLPFVQPKIKTGKWIYRNYNWYCSECENTPKTLGYVGKAEFMKEHFKFCNHCGAMMLDTVMTEDERENQC